MIPLAKTPTRVLCASALALLAAGCASAKVTTDWDRGANFGAYNTYAWMETPQMQALQRNSLFDKRLRSSVERQLDAKGFRKTDGDADLLLVYHAGMRDKLDVQQSGYFGRNVSVRQYQQGTLVVDLVDAKRKELVWRGTASGEVDKPDPSGEALDKTLSKMFESFPPRG